MITLNAGEDVEKLDCLHIVGGNVKWQDHSGKKYGTILTKLNTHLPISSNCTPRRLFQKNENMIRQKPVHDCS